MAFGQDSTVPPVATDDHQLDLLIEQLASDDYVERSQAKRALIKIGLPALERLRRVSQFDASPDFNTALLAKQIVNEVEANQTQRKAEGFLNQRNSLPGWERFENRYGDFPTARKLFAKIYIEYASELESLDALSTEQVKKLLSTQSIFSIKPQSVYEPVARIAGAAFISSVAVEHKPTISQTRGIVDYLARTDFTRKIAEDDSAEIVVNLLNDFFEKCSTNPLIQARKTQFFASLQHPATLPLLHRQLKDDRLSIYTRAYILKSLVELYGNKTLPLTEANRRESVEVLTELFENGSPLGTYYLPSEASINEPGDTDASDLLLHVQLRDLALAAAILIEQRSVVDFGFSPKATAETKQKGIELVLKFAGFRNDSMRTQAFQDWTQRSQPATATNRPNASTPDTRMD